MFGIENYAEKIENLGDALVFGGAVVLIGMATIFSVLIVLWMFLSLFKIFFHDLPEKKKKAAVVPVVEAPVQTVNRQNDEIVAVIAAAIAMAESESSGLKFRVVSFKRK